MTGGPHDGGAQAWAPEGVHPDDVTAPQPVIVVPAEPLPPDHHEGPPGPPVSAPGHDVGAAADAEAPSSGRRVALGAVGAVLAAVGLVSVLAFVLADRGEESAASGSASSSSPADATPAGTLGGAVAAPPTGSAVAPMFGPSQPTLVLGDSLGLVVYPWLADLLPDRYVSYEAEVGRSTAGTAAALSRLSSVPPVVVVSSGTNDQLVGELTTNATRILDTLGPKRCVVWVDVVRPDTVGDPQAQMNAALDGVVAGRANVRLLRWSALVADHPEWLSGDGIHPNEAGARARAQAIADAAAACSPIDLAAPRASRQVLPQSAFWGPVSGSGANGGSSSGSSGGSSASSSPSRRSASASPSRTPSSSPTVASTPTQESPPTPTPTPDPTTPAPAAEPTTTAAAP